MENTQIDPNNARAALGFSTNLLEQHLQAQKPQETAQTPETEPKPEEKTPKEETPKEEPKDPMKDMELMFSEKIDAMRKELKEDNQREIDNLKETITSALAEDEPNETSKPA